MLVGGPGRGASKIVCMREWDGPGVVALFIDGARLISAALARPEVAEAWDRPSVLERQTVGGLAGHLARAGVWVVADYLDNREPTGPVDITSPGAYFATLLRAASEDTHAAIRQRGADLAAMGHSQLTTMLAQRLEGLTHRLTTEPRPRLISVISGRVMTLEDYLDPHRRTDRPHR
jgi:hypothetical protein